MCLWWREGAHRHRKQRSERGAHGAGTRVSYAHRQRTRQAAATPQPPAQLYPPGQTHADLSGRRAREVRCRRMLRRGASRSGAIARAENSQRRDCGLQTGSARVHWSHFPAPPGVARGMCPRRRTRPLCCSAVGIVGARGACAADRAGAFGNRRPSRRALRVQTGCAPLRQPASVHCVVTPGVEPQPTIPVAHPQGLWR